MAVSKVTPAGRIFDAINMLVLTGVAATMVLPFVYVFAGSLAGEAEISSRAFFLWPQHVVTSTYRYMFESNDAFVRSLFVTIGVTAVGTLVQLALTFTMAYPLSKRFLPGRSLILGLVVFTMIFTGGLVPLYLTVRNLGLLDTYWALILPAAISPFYLIIVKNFIEELPVELQEAAMIDGCTEFSVFWRIILPLSKPIMAAMALFFAVGIWNDFMSPLLYLSKPSMWTLQMFVRQVTVSPDINTTLGIDDPNNVPPEQGLKFAVVVVATLPILLMYPFLQKHFAKGMLIGSVKA